MERIVFERLVLKDYKLQNYKCFLEPDYIVFKNVAEFVLTRQRDLLVRCNSLDNFSSQFVMEDFLFEGKFHQHYKILRENVEAFVSFNNDRCSSILNEKITIPLYYNNKLDVENGKSGQTRSLQSANLSSKVGKFPAKLPLTFLISTMGALFSTKNLLKLLLLSIHDQLTRLSYLGILLTIRIDDKLTTTAIFKTSLVLSFCL